jgi:2',3'-cyclic-nucleotide 2'-phosphodiesterase (5'-nucleotidase family)
MAAAGKYGNYLGEVNLTFEAHKVVHKTAKIIPLEHHVQNNDAYDYQK